MARVTGLKLRSGRWTLRVRVPDKLREVLKKREISKSFGDVSASEAARLARIERVAIDEQFEAARILLRQTPAERPSVDEVRHLARVYFHRLEVSAPPVPFDDLERDAMAEANAEDLMAVSQPIWDTSLQQVAMGVALEAKFDLLTASSDFKDLCEGIRRAQIEHHVRQIDRLAQSHVQPQDPLFADVSATTPPVSQLTLAKAIQLYKDAPERSGVAEKTRASDKFRFAALMDLLGSSKPVAEITRDDCRNARDVLLKLPPHAPKRFPGMAFAEVARLATQRGLPTISSKSALLYIECLSALYRWLLQEEHVLRNPAVGLKGPPVPNSTRRPFTVTELNELFAASPFNGANGVNRRANGTLFGAISASNWDPLSARG